MNKPNKDGWIRHRGKMQPPVEPGTIIDVRYRNGDIDEASEVGEGEEWLHEGSPYDVMAWRPRKPDVEALIQEGIDSADAGNLTQISEVRAKWVNEVTDKSRDIEMPAAKYFDGPIQWRDRIREIDATAIALNEERASLVAKLKAEGFALIQSDEPNVAAESAQQDIAQQDMSDPTNWRVGDLVAVINPEDSCLRAGDMAKIIEIDIDSDDMPCKLEGSSTWLWIENMKWHSRPTN